METNVPRFLPKWLMASNPYSIWQYLDAINIPFQVNQMILRKQSTYILFLFSMFYKEISMQKNVNKNILQRHSQKHEKPITHTLHISCTTTYTQKLNTSVFLSVSLYCHLYSYALCSHIIQDVPTSVVFKMQFTC